MMMPVQRVGDACAVQSCVGNALRRWDGLAGLPRVFHAAGGMHRPSGGGLEPRGQPPQKEEENRFTGARPLDHM